MRRDIEQLNREIDNAGSDGELFMLYLEILTQRPELSDLFRAIMNLDPETQREAIETAGAMLAPRAGFIS